MYHIWRFFQIQVVILYFYVNNSKAIEPVSTGVAIGGAIIGSALYSGWDQMKCKWENDCCSPPSIKHNVSQFEELFDKYVYGQHLARDIVTKALRSHLRKLDPSNSNNPKKALVMSFHGWTGGGKNYVAKFLADSLFAKGIKSKNVHLFVSTLHFPIEEKADLYKSNLVNWIRGNVSSCEQSLFIFDEMDKMPLGMVDGLKAFIDHHESVSGIDFRRCIFVFLSNTGGREITDIAYQFWKEGKTRESISYVDLENLIRNGAFNEKGGLHKSNVVERHLVDFYVPFLPLERIHVKQCIEFQIQKAVNEALTGEEYSKHKIQEIKSAMNKKVDTLLAEMTFGPGASNLYSTTGCKRVGPKVDLLLEDTLIDVT